MRRHHASWIAIGLAVACVPDEQTAKAPLPVRVSIDGRERLMFEHPLRLALLFRAGTATIAAADVPIPEGTNELELSLAEAPRTQEMAQETLEVIEILYLPALLARRPQLVVYEDLDESGDFAVDIDRPAGVDRTFGIAFLPELEQRFRALTFGQVDAYYQATGGRFSEFVRTLPQAPQTGRIYLQNHQVPIPIELDLSGRSENDLACFRTGTFNQSMNFPVSNERRVFVGGGLELIDACGTELGLCEPADLGSIEPPPIALVETATVVRRVQCRARGELAAYLVEEARPECVDCRCGWGLDTDVYFARTSSVPPWWPCGMEVETCTASAPLYQLVPDCE